MKEEINVLVLLVSFNSQMIISMNKVFYDRVITTS